LPVAIAVYSFDTAMLSGSTHLQAPGAWLGCNCGPNVLRNVSSVTVTLPLTGRARIGSIG